MESHQAKVQTLEQNVKSLEDEQGLLGGYVHSQSLTSSPGGLYPYRTPITGGRGNPVPLRPLGRQISDETHPPNPSTDINANLTDLLRGGGHFEGEQDAGNPVVPPKDEQRSRRHRHKPPTTPYPSLLASNPPNTTPPLLPLSAPDTSGASTIAGNGATSSAPPRRVSSHISSMRSGFDRGRLTPKKPRKGLKDNPDDDDSDPSSSSSSDSDDADHRRGSMRAPLPHQSSHRSLLASIVPKRSRAVLNSLTLASTVRWMDELHDQILTNPDLGPVSYASQTSQPVNRRLVVHVRAHPDIFNPDRYAPYGMMTKNNTRWLKVVTHILKPHNLQALWAMLGFITWSRVPGPNPHEELVISALHYTDSFMEALELATYWLDDAALPHITTRKGEPGVAHHFFLKTPKSLLHVYNSHTSADERANLKTSEEFRLLVTKALLAFATSAEHWSSLEQAGCLAGPRLDRDEREGQVRNSFPPRIQDRQHQSGSNNTGPASQDRRHTVTDIVRRPDSGHPSASQYKPNRFHMLTTPETANDMLENDDDYAYDWSPGAEDNQEIVFNDPPGYFGAMAHGPPMDQQGRRLACLQMIRNAKCTRVDCQFSHDKADLQRETQRLLDDLETSPFKPMKQTDRRMHALNEVAGEADFQESVGTGMDTGAASRQEVSPASKHT